MSWPNATHARGSDNKVRALLPADPQWRSVAGRPGIYIHDSDPGHEVEVIAYSCPECFEAKTTYHSTIHATPEGRQVHGTCSGCNVAMMVVTERDERGWPKWLRRPSAGFKV